ncbi:uncharacterized protein SPSK_07911 [Sporothrix schenckii 1099-18]|uniref:Uncharacterized protein n=2 Tax=Sporothrix schenckii TaxID=29908 RepID=U7Q358_SPOS1|nr:uncharacterized protein SPSK_07911 [Sporothrix schenckii 1099-18]ERT01415.1 hypothetical protein HMPREF1624_02661 [Sporothrix schenckii ATCC 58251]KJR88604.1 hypothetical protein SPSK_07911 [Sporothrix schenckii 1099-18]
MAPIPAFKSRLLVPTHDISNTASSLRTGSLTSRSFQSTIPVTSAPSHTPITPSIAFHRVAGVLFEHFDNNKNRAKRDDETDSDTNHKRYEIILPIIGGCVVLWFLYSWTRNHFRRGGTWKAYGKAWLTGLKYFLFFTVLLPITLLGCVVGCFSACNNKGKPKPAANAANPNRVGALPRNRDNREPPPLNRPLMPLDPVVVMPDLPDQEDPDAVEVLPPPPPPIAQKNETTAEATETFLSSDGKNISSGSGLIKGSF